MSFKTSRYFIPADSDLIGVDWLLIQATPLRCRVVRADPELSGVLNGTTLEKCIDRAARGVWREITKGEALYLVAQYRRVGGNSRDKPVTNVDAW